MTALIPAFVGIPILVLGLAALKESIRKHAMHGVSLLALLGFLLPAGRLSMKLVQGEHVKTTILVSLVLMAVLCGVLLAACVRSFVLRETESTPPIVTRSVSEGGYGINRARSGVSEAGGITDARGPDVARRPSLTLRVTVRTPSLTLRVMISARLVRSCIVTVCV